MRDLLPDAFPIAAAAALCGQYHKTFRRHAIATGLVKLDARGRVTRKSLERHLGFVITNERYLEADRKLDGARQYQQSRRDACKMEMADARA